MHVQLMHVRDIVDSCLRIKNWNKHFFDINVGWERNTEERFPVSCDGAFLATLYDLSQHYIFIRRFQRVKILVTCYVRDWIRTNNLKNISVFLYRRNTFQPINLFLVPCVCARYSVSIAACNLGFRHEYSQTTFHDACFIDDRLFY